MNARLTRAMLAFSFADPPVSFHSLDEQRRQQRAAATITREAYDLALARYREGLGDYLQVLSAEQRCSRSEASTRILPRARWSLRSTSCALGGGYEASPARISMTTGR